MAKQSSSAASGTEEKRQNFFVRNQFVFSLLVPAFLLSTAQGFTLPVLPVIAREQFGASAAGASATVIAPMLGSVLSTLPTGYVIDRFGRRVTLIAAPLFASISSFLVVFASSYLELLLFLALWGIAQQMWQMSRIAAIADAVRVNQRGRQITGMSSVQRIGTLSGPILGGILGSVVGLRSPYVVAGVLAALAVVPSYLLIKESAPGVLARRAGAAVQKVDVSWKKLLNRTVVVLFVAQFFANVGRGGVTGNSGVHIIFLAYAYNTGPAVLGAALTATGLVGIPIMLLSGQIMDRFGRKRQIVPAALMVGSGIGAMTCTAAFSLPIAAFFVSFVWINIGITMMAGTMQTLGADIAPPEARGKFFGVNRLIANSGSLTNPVSFFVVNTLIAGATGFATSFAFMSICAFIAAGLIAFGMPETLKKEKQATARA